MYRRCHVNCISSQTPHWTQIFPPYISNAGNQKLDTTPWKHIHQQHVETRLKSLHPLPSKLYWEGQTEETGREALQSGLYRVERIHAHIQWGWQLCWNGKGRGDQKRWNICPSGNTSSWCVWVCACVCVCVLGGCRWSITLAMHFVCLCLSITCSAALTPISQWSVFNLNHIATSPRRPTHWQGQLSWLEVKWDECILCVCVYFISKCVIRNLHRQNGGNTSFVLLLILLHNLYLLYVVHTNFAQSVLQLLAVSHRFYHLWNMFIY